MKSQPLERSAGRLLARSLLGLLVVSVGSATCQSAPGQELADLGANFPYYMQSPLPQPEPPAVIMQRSNVVLVGGQPQLPVASPPVQQANLPLAGQKVSAAAAPPPGSCLYGQHYFAHFDQCLERKPYPTIGLPAFKNDDLLAQRSPGALGERHGCSFILTNGLFKHYQLTKSALQDADSKCLEDNKLAHLSMKFSNVTLYYLWQLRCLNQANQLLDDATLEGRSATIEHAHEHEQQQQQRESSGAEGICVGSSQNFGFASLQVSNIESQVELAIDIYKNWRVTNITLAMLPAPAASLKSEHDEQLKSAAIRDFTFESLDGDELNWRYLNLYENWTRNRLHTNFLEQFKRFLWISLQRCLSESADKLPLKLVDMFGQQRYNN